ncbi:MAG: hypothetical protein LAO79_28525, partial [Acidobacteriia bacterium]|nr:hypothetical protein [Terriglobia bacterium]
MVAARGRSLAQKRAIQALQLGKRVQRVRNPDTEDKTIRPRFRSLDFAEQQTVADFDLDCGAGGNFDRSRELRNVRPAIDHPARNRRFRAGVQNGHGRALLVHEGLIGSARASMNRSGG